MDKNLISVNIVAYNAQKTLAKTLESIKKQVGVVFEIIFVNDASDDNTLSIIENFKKENSNLPCTVITNQTNLGITKSRNIALSHSNGSHIAVCDSDDVWIDSKKLFQQMNIFIQNPNIVAVGTQMNIVTDTGEKIKETRYQTTNKKIKKHFLYKNQIGHSSALFKKTDLQYDESLYIWEDYDFFLKLGLVGEIININEVMVNYLYNPKKYSFEQKKKLNETEFQIIKKYKNKYPNFWLGYCKYVIKKVLILLHLK